MEHRIGMGDIIAADHLMRDLQSARAPQDRRDRRFYRAIQSSEAVGVLAIVAGAVATVVYALSERNPEAFDAGIATFTAAAGTGALEFSRRTLRNINPNVAKPKPIRGLNAF